LRKLPTCLQELDKLNQNSVRNEIELPEGYRRAGVLIPLLKEEDGWYLLFTRRTELVTHHKNEISFPGGGFDPSQDQDITQTALREANEEIGCENVKTLGLLDDIYTISQYIVTPVVGYIVDHFTTSCNDHNSDEIQYVLKVALNRISNPKNFWMEEVIYREVPIQVPFFDYDGEIIWGATGRILDGFLRILSQLGYPCKNEMIGTNDWKGLRERD
jgi:8-oxo-dGTP pyrophosphatase MutT (NUDIX family)